MEIPDDLNSFKKTGMKLYVQLKQATKEKDYVWIIVFIFVVIFVFISSIGLFIDGLNGIGLIKENILAPKNQLTYEWKIKNQEDGSKYLSVFILKFSVPMGQSTGKLLFYHPDGCNSDNMNLINAGGTNLKNNTIYAESSYEITCITNNPIEDSLELFRPKN